MIRASAHEPKVRLRRCEIKLLDTLIIVFAVGLTVLSAYSAYINPSGNTQVQIQGQDSEWIYNIDSEETVVLNGPIGETVVRLGGGSAWVESSPCDNQNCVAAGRVSKAGQWAACLPNQVLVLVKSDGSGNEGEDNEVDAITQ